PGALIPRRRGGAPGLIFCYKFQISGGRPMHFWAFCTFALLAGLVLPAQAQPPAGGKEWPVVGNDSGGQRFSPLTQIDKENVGKLKIAWTYRTGDFSHGDGKYPPTSFQATPILIKGAMYLCTPFNRIIALDPA